MSEDARSVEPPTEDADEGALFVLTAAMLTPGRFPGVLGDDYPAACAELGLDPVESGYGLVFGQDPAGARWTVATTDAAMVACALAAWDCGLEYDLSPDEDSMAASLPGWPLPVAVAVPGIPEPHDPDEETGGRPALCPPDTSVWGPPQRRLGADEIAVRWIEWRDQFEGAGTEPSAEAGQEAAAAADGTPEGRPASTAPVSSEDDGDREAGAKAEADAPETAPGATADEEPTGDAAAGPPVGGAAEAPAAVSHEGVRRALAGAEEYVRNPPPPGRVRTAYGAVRADGPGWSLVARTDDMAFVLLDDAPGEVLPVGRGPSLPPLLEALGRLASVSPV